MVCSCAKNNRVTCPLYANHSTHCMPKCHLCSKEMIGGQNTTDWGTGTTHTSCWEEFEKRCAEKRCTVCNKQLPANWGEDNHHSHSSCWVGGETVGYPGTWWKQAFVFYFSKHDLRRLTITIHLMLILPPYTYFRHCKHGWSNRRRI